MPNFPIVDSHLHLWDPARFSYPWLFDPLDRAFLPADFRAASAGVEIEALVFLECDAAIDQALDMPRQEQCERMQRMDALISRYDITHWTHHVLELFAQLRAQ